MNENASLKIWQTLQPMVRKEVAKGTESSVKSKKMVVTTAYNTSTKTVGVTEAFGKEIQVPVAGMINPDRLRVGTSVWVIALHGSWSNAIVCMLGDGQIPPANFAPRNLLDNSDFTNPVNQRNITSKDATFTGYTIDRWIVQNTGSLFTLDSNGLNLAAETSFKYIYQRLNNVTVGKTYTLAACLSDGTIGTLTFTLTTTTGGFAWLKAAKISDSLRLGVGHSANIPLFAALSNINDTAARIVWAALYEGSYTADTLPPYVPKPYVVELAECQRYYVRLRLGVGFYGFVGSGGSTAYLYFDLPQQMRMANPTATTTGRFFIRATSGSVNATTISYSTIYGKQLELAVVVSMTANTPFTGYAESAIEISADL